MKNKRRSKLSKSSFVFLITGAFLVLSFTALKMFAASETTNAADIVVSRTGVNQFGAASVQLSSTAALDENTFTSNNRNIVLRDTYKYTAEDVANGRMIADKDFYDYVTFAGVLQANSAATGIGEKYVMYDGGIDANSAVVLVDPFTMRYPGKVVDASNNTFDLMLYFREIRIENRANRAITKPVGLFNGRALSAWTALQEANNQQEVLGRSSINSSIIRNHGVEMTVEAKVVRPGTEIPVTDKLIPFRWTDLDVYDFTTDNRATYDGPFVESIMLANGIYGNVFVEPDTLLNITSSNYGANTSFRATASDDNTVRSGVGYLANSASSTFIWHGRDCATSMGFLQTSKITTSKYGDYASKATIDASDNSVLWKEDKTINMSAADGYYINEVKVDGTVIYSGTDQTKIRYQYPFYSVIANHTVAVSAARKTGRTAIHHYVNGSTKLYEDTIVNGYIGDAFDCSAYILTTNEKYEVSSLPETSTCLIGEGDYSVTIQYRKKTGVIHVRYIDIDTNEEIGTQDFTGIVDGELTIEAISFPRYLLVTDPKKVEKIYTVDEQTVDFYYRLRSDGDDDGGDDGGADGNIPAEYPATKPTNNPKTNEENPLPNLTIVSSFGVFAVIVLAKLLKRR